MLDAWLNKLAPMPANDRLRVTVRFAHPTGARESELANARVSGLRQDSGEGGAPVCGI